MLPIYWIDMVANEKKFNFNIQREKNVYDFSLLSTVRYLLQNIFISFLFQCSLCINFIYNNVCCAAL